VIYDGLWNVNEINDAYDKYKINSRDEVEGYVVRIAEEFPYGYFRRYVAKFVRDDHVQDVVHNWKYQQIIQNKVRIK